jgi:hypothetical protein
LFASSLRQRLTTAPRPNQPYPQSDLSPQDAAVIHKRAVQPFADKGYSIIAPATSSAPSGFDWVTDFFKYCDGCKFDAIAIHYYDITPEGFIAYMEKWHAAWPNLQMFVTEFACQNFNGGAQCSPDQTWYFWSTAIKYMEAQPWITAYFGFGSLTSLLCRRYLLTESQVPCARCRVSTPTTSS